MRFGNKIVGPTIGMVALGLLMLAAMFSFATPAGAQENPPSTTPPTEVPTQECSPKTRPYHPENPSDYDRTTTTTTPCYTTIPLTREITQDEYNELVEQGDTVKAMDQNTDATKHQTDVIFGCTFVVSCLLMALIVISSSRGSSS